MLIFFDFLGAFSCRPCKSSAKGCAGCGLWWLPLVASSHRPAIAFSLWAFRVRQGRGASLLHGHIVSWLRQGLNKGARKVAEAWPARRGGDFRSHRKPAGPAFRQPRTPCESPHAAPIKKNKPHSRRCNSPCCSPLPL
jgi:hypothetical protein